MKTVGLITLHRTANYGSVLQAFATQKFLETIGFEVKVIDYYPNRNKISSMLKGLRNKSRILEHNPLALAAARLIILPSYIKRRHVFDKYIFRELNLTEKTYYDLEDFESSPVEADIYITGSDQVWNSIWNDGVDEILYMSFVPDNVKKYALASSFGMDCLPEHEIPITQKLLCSYNHITVRESDGVDILHSLGIYDAEQVLDPTLLLSRTVWLEHIPLFNSDIKPYILMYNINHNRRLDEFANRLSAETDLHIKYVSYQLHDVVKHGKMYCCTSVENFLSLIANATYVVCDSFHCAAFSVNLNKEFAIVMPERFGSRLTSFMKVVGLEDRIVDSENTAVFNSPIDWRSVNTRLKNERAKSIGIIKQMLEVI